jgi:SAM-dependent methyltransferase
MFNFLLVAFSIVGAVYFIFWPSIKHLTVLAGKAGFAWLLKIALRVDNIIFGKGKKEIFSCLHEMSSRLDRPLKLVEVGAGTGANFVFLPKNMEIVCVEPNEFSKKFLLANAAKFPGIEIKQYHIGFGEDMTFIETESVDAVVCTHVLCSVRDVDQCLKEILRILKKGGKFLFMEHIEAASGSRTKYWQHFFKRPWHVFADGCHLTRRIHVNIEKAGFSKLDLSFFDMENLWSLNFLFKRLALLIIPHCQGVATK